MSSAQPSLHRPTRLVFELESALSTSLRPVDPDPRFVHRLSDRFRQPPAIVLERRSFLGAYVIMASGLFVGALLLWFVQRLGRSLRTPSPAG